MKSSNFFISVIAFSGLLIFNNFFSSKLNASEEEMTELNPISSNSCANYPASTGIQFVDRKDGVKVLSTAQVPVPIDDVDVINMSLEEAEIEAKREMLELMKGQNIDSRNEGESEQSSKISVSQGREGKKKGVSMDKKTQLKKTWQSKTKGKLRGIAVVGNCYTPGEFVLVTVGLKEELMELGNKMKRTMGQENVIDKLVNKFKTKPVEDDSSVMMIQQTKRPITGFSNNKNLLKYY